jgi:transposase
MNNEEGLRDGRKIPDEVMGYIRKMAVQAVRERGQSPEVVAQIFNFNRSCIYRWLKHYDEGGYEALESQPAPGAEPVVTSEMDVWLKQTVLTHTPVDFGYDTTLWTRDILAQLLKKEFGVAVSGSTVSLHLRKLGLSYQQPAYQDRDRDPGEVERFLNDKFPSIQRLADKLGADIGFEDEAGVGIMTRSGRTWGLVGKTPVVRVCMKRGGYNVLSMVTPKGELKYSVTADSVDSVHYIEFLKNLIRDRERPLILLVDRISFHRSQEVRDFVRAHRAQLRIFFLPRRAPQMNPDEQVWNEIKNHRIGKQPVENKNDLKKRLYSALRSVQKNTGRILSFFQLPATQYASVYVV